MALSIYWTKRTWSWIQYPSSKRQFRKRKNILLSLVYILPRKRMWAFSRRSRAEMAKKGTEKVCCKCRDVVLLLCRRYRCRRRRRILSTLISPNWDNCRCTKCSQHVAWEKSQASINPRGRVGSDLHEVDGTFSTEMKIKTWLNAAMRKRGLALTDFAGDLVLSRLNLSCKLHFRNHTVSFDWISKSLASWLLFLSYCSLQTFLMCLSQVSIDFYAKNCPVVILWFNY